MQAEKKQRAEEMEQMVSAGTDIVNENEAVRLPNAIKRPKGLTLSTDPNAPTQQMVMSPTSFLTGQAASPRLHSFFTNDDATSV